MPIYSLRTYRWAIVALVVLSMGLGGGRRTRTSTVVVTSTTTGAKLFIDGHEVGEVPMRMPLALRSGLHTVKVSRPGYADYIDSFEIDPGEDLVLEIDLLATAGVLRVNASVFDAHVFADGQPLGPVPYDGELEPGSRTIQVRAPGHAAFEQTFEVMEGQVYPLEVTLVPLPARVRNRVVGDGDRSDDTAWYGHWWVWAGAAVVVAGGVTAAVLASGADDGSPEPDYTVPIDLAP